MTQTGTGSAPARPAMLTRRHGLKVIAGIMALPLGALALQKLAAHPHYHTWTGESLGGPASLTLWHPNARFAEQTVARVRAEVERLEAVFSLFRADSEISRLNRDGVLVDASPDIVAALTQSHRIAADSGGAFDPTVQPLWRLYEAHFHRHPDAASGPAARAVEAARRLVDYRRIEIGSARIEFSRPGMAITLNGIAQGYITDRVADLLRQEGFEHALVEVGETRALGGSPEGGPWTIAIEDPRHPLSVNRSVDIADAALSVSGGYGLRFGRSALNHIFDPGTGSSAAKVLDVVVIAPRATTADALSTAIFVSGEQAAPGLLAHYPDTRAVLTRLDGSTATV
jgi:thiamine biosynthesis lipoprotein